MILWGSRGGEGRGGRNVLHVGNSFLCMCGGGGQQPGHMASIHELWEKFPASHHFDIHPKRALKLDCKSRGL